MQVSDRVLSCTDEDPIGRARDVGEAKAINDDELQILYQGETYTR